MYYTSAHLEFMNVKNENIDLKKMFNVHSEVKPTLWTSKLERMMSCNFSLRNFQYLFFYSHCATKRVSRIRVICFHDHIFSWFIDSMWLWKYFFFFEYSLDCLEMNILLFIFTSIDSQLIRLHGHQRLDIVSSFENNAWINALWINIACMELTTVLTSNIMQQNSALSVPSQSNGIARISNGNNDVRECVRWMARHKGTMLVLHWENPLYFS